MKRTVVYWKTKDRERKDQLKAELGINSESVNGESEYMGGKEKLEQYVREGLISVRLKDDGNKRIGKKGL